jgi:hypothetical protein
MTENMRYLLIFRGFETPTACRLVTRLDENERRCITAFPSPKHLVYYGIEIGSVVLALTVQEQAMPLAMRRWVIDDKYQTRRRATQTTHWQDSHKSAIKRHRFKYAETRELGTLNLGVYCSCLQPRVTLDQAVNMYRKLRQCNSTVWCICEDRSPKTRCLDLWVA